MSINFNTLYLLLHPPCIRWNFFSPQKRKPNLILTIIYRPSGSCYLFWNIAIWTEQNQVKSNQIKSFIILAVICRSVKRVSGAHFRVIAPAGNTAPFEEMSQRWRAVGNTVSDLTGPRFEPLTSRSRDERVTAHQLTARPKPSHSTK